MVLGEFTPTKSEMILDYYHQMLETRVASRVAEDIQSNTKFLRLTTKKVYWGLCIS